MWKRSWALSESGSALPLSSAAPSSQTFLTLPTSVGSYVRVIGNLRSFMDTRSVLAFRVLPIERFDEVTYHFLDAMHVHLAVTKGDLVRRRRHDPATLPFSLPILLPLLS